MIQKAIDQIEHIHRGEQQSVQAEGHAAAMRGEGREGPYSPSRWEHNHWTYGYMLGLQEFREAARNARG